MRVALVFHIDPTSREAIQALVDQVYQADCAFLAAHPQAPDLYRSGVVYGREPRGAFVEGGEERFAGVLECLRVGWGDCDDLAPWRAAELTVREGLPSRALVIPAPGSRPGGPPSWHVVVQRGDGVMEDPSAQLGMLDP